MEFNLNFDLTDAGSEYMAKDISEDVLYDCVVVGGGPAAVTAAVYLMRKGLSTAMIVKAFGGQVAETKEIENYTGYKYIEGHDLSSKFTQQVKQFEIAVAEGIMAAGFDLFGKEKKVILEDNRVVKAKTIILCLGSSWKRLNVVGEEEFLGRGVAFCSTCDAPFFAGKKVLVVGGGNTGAEAALDLLKVASHVTIAEIDTSLKADKLLLDKIKAYSNYDVLFSAKVKEIKGKDRVESVVVENIGTKEAQEILFDGVFVEIGMKPNTDLLKDSLKLNDFGEIETDDKCNTSIPGVFAAGDVTSVPYKQVVIAAGEGAKAALSVNDYLIKND